MTHGRHVTAEECERIREWRRRGFMREVIGKVLLDEPLSPDSVGHHALGYCAHGGDPVPPEPPEEKNNDQGIPTL